MSDKDRIRDMIMALSRGDIEEANKASSDVISSKTAKIIEGKVNEAHWGKPCPCGSGEMGWWEEDARGIPLDVVCDDCRDEKLSKYRSDVLDDPDYWADEPIEPEDY